MVLRFVGYKGEALGTRRRIAPAQRWRNVFSKASVLSGYPYAGPDVLEIRADYRFGDDGRVISATKLPVLY